MLGSEGGHTHSNSLKQSYFKYKYKLKSDEQNELKRWLKQIQADTWLIHICLHTLTTFLSILYF